jgi:hypothetical protein
MLKLLLVSRRRPLLLRLLQQLTNTHVHHTLVGRAVQAGL